MPRCHFVPSPIGDCRRFSNCVRQMAATVRAHTPKPQSIGLGCIGKIDARPGPLKCHFAIWQCKFNAHAHMLSSNSNLFALKACLCASTASPRHALSIELIESKSSSNCAHSVQAAPHTVYTFERLHLLVTLGCISTVRRHLQYMQSKRSVSCTAHSSHQSDAICWVCTKMASA